MSLMLTRNGGFGMHNKIRVPPPGGTIAMEFDHRVQPKLDRIDAETMLVFVGIEQHLLVVGAVVYLPKMREKW